jgi:hypothetical protein
MHTTRRWLTAVRLAAARAERIDKAILALLLCFFLSFWVLARTKRTRGRGC